MFLRVLFQKQKAFLFRSNLSFVSFIVHDSCYLSRLYWAVPSCKSPGFFWTVTVSAFTCRSTDLFWHRPLWTNYTLSLKRSPTHFQWRSPGVLRSLPQWGWHRGMSCSLMEIRTLFTEQIPTHGAESIPKPSNGLIGCCLLQRTALSWWEQGKAQVTIPSPGRLQPMTNQWSHRVGQPWGTTPTPELPVGSG